MYKDARFCRDLAAWCFDYSYLLRSAADGIRSGSEAAWFSKEFLGCWYGIVLSLPNGWC